MTIGEQKFLDAVPHFLKAISEQTYMIRPRLVKVSNNHYVNSNEVAQIIANSKGDLTIILNNNNEVETNFKSIGEAAEALGLMLN